MLGLAIDGRTSWRSLVFRRLLRIRSGKPPVFDLRVTLGSDDTLTAQMTLGRRVELRFRPTPTQLSPDPIDAEFHATAETAEPSFYGFDVERFVAGRSTARGVLALWGEPGGENFTGRLLVEEHEPAVPTDLRFDGSTTTVPAVEPQIQLTAVTFDTIGGWDVATVERVATWSIETKPGATTAVRLLLVEQHLPVGGEGGPDRVVAAVHVERGGVVIDGVAPIAMSHTSGGYSFDTTGGVLALFPEAERDAAADLPADLAFPGPGAATEAGGEPSQVVRLGRIKTAYLRAGVGLDPQKTPRPPLFARWVGDRLKTYRETPLPIDPVSDRNLFGRFDPLPIDEPMLTHQTARAGPLRLRPANGWSPAEVPGIIPDSELPDGTYFIGAIEAPVDAGSPELIVRVEPVAANVETGSPWDARQTETLLVLLDQAEAGGITGPGRRGTVLPLAPVSVSTPITTAGDASLIPADNVRRARLRFGPATVFVRRTLRGAGPSFEFLRSGALVEAVRRLREPAVASADVQVVPLMVDVDARRLDPEQAAAAALVEPVEAVLRPRPLDYTAISGQPDGPDRLRRITLFGTLTPANDTATMQTLRLHWVTAFSPRWGGPTAGLGGASTLLAPASFAPFVPRNLTWQAGSVKPGALQHLIVRLVGTRAPTRGGAGRWRSRGRFATWRFASRNGSTPPPEPARGSARPSSPRLTPR